MRRLRSASAPLPQIISRQLDQLVALHAGFKVHTARLNISYHALLNQAEKHWNNTGMRDLFPGDRAMFDV